MHIRSLIIASVAVIALSSSAFAACQPYVTVTDDIAPISAKYSPMAGGGNDGLDPRGPRLSNACQPGSTHPWAEGMQRAGGACDRMANLKSLSVPVGGNALLAAAVPGVDVPDIVEHRNGFNSPIAIPRLGVEAGFNPWPGNAGALQPGACP